VPNPDFSEGSKVIAEKRAEAMKQLEGYASADIFSGKTHLRRSCIS
jgi:hypothetical protein